MTKLYRVFIAATDIPLETVTAVTVEDAIAQVRAMYPHYDGSLTAILVKEIEWEPPKLE